MTIDQMSYLLAFVSAIATLAGLGFAFYGFYNISHAEHIVSKQVEGYIRDLEARLTSKQVQSQEAIQKVITAYALSAQEKHQTASELLRAAVAADPDVFNGYTALGYEYWTLGKQHDALECFLEAARRFPDRPESYNDLARIYAQMGEQALALKYIKETLHRDPACLDGINKDICFEKIRTDAPDQYKAATNLK